MQYNFVLIRTQKGRKYSNKIISSLRWLNQHRFKKDAFNCFNFTIEEFLELDDDFFIKECPPHNTVIHARCANPHTDWTVKLRELEENGFKVVNSVDCIEMTSDKLACSLHLQGKVEHPKTWEYDRKINGKQFSTLIRSIDANLESPDFIIAKPLTSLEQGANVQKIKFGGEKINAKFEDEDDLFDMPPILDMVQLRKEFDKVPGNKIVIQECIPYTALHRVIVIGGKALPYTFVDYANDPRKKDWKVSCCLNRTTMKLNENANLELLRLAEKTQQEVGGIINFIDIFEYPAGGGGVWFTNAEINTACSLNIHELLAQKAGRKDWNIHYQIAKQLTKEAGLQWKK